MKKAIFILSIGTIIGLIAFVFLKKKCVPLTDYTNVTIKNSSQEDSVLVYVTLQSPNSVLGLFGITNTIGSCSKGTFYAHRDTFYQSNDSSQLLGVVVSFVGDNLPCQTAIPIGFRWGINIFECSLNVPFEVFDISCEDGVNSTMRVTVDDTLWSTGDGEHIAVFKTAENKFPVSENINIRGVFGYRCSNCTHQVSPAPENCLNIKDSCSLFNTCQVARTNHNGGNITLEYLGSPQILSK